MPGCVFESRWLLSANGPLTLVAYFSLPACTSAAVIAARRSGVASLPSGESKTTCRMAPLRAPNLSLRTSVAFCASEPGITNLFSSVPLTGPKARKQMTMKTKRPPKTVRLGCEAWLVAMPR